MVDKDLQIYSKDKSSVKELQSYLKKLGYVKFQPTGNFGKLTQQALQKFQKDNGIQATGKL
jgi:carboxyl-terminal processing protease